MEELHRILLSWGEIINGDENIHIKPCVKKSLMISCY
jgi:hypothetical protein